jgi:hypothetical protein
MKINKLFDLDRATSIADSHETDKVLPENTEKGIVTSFHELFADPDFVEKLRQSVGKMGDHTKEMLANATINRITRLEHGIEKIHDTTHTRLERLLHEVEVTAVA